MRVKALFLPMLAVLALLLVGTSCTTTYDAQGYPVQSVTPEGAALGALAAGMIGYALADDNHGHYGHHGGHHGRRHGRYHH